MVDIKKVNMKEKNDLAKRVLLRFLENLGFIFLALFISGIGILIIYLFNRLVMSYPIIILYLIILVFVGGAAITAYKTEAKGKNDRYKKSKSSNKKS